ncbi:MAG TPA: ATP-binding protein [Candidatus Paceibacterota bacterium]|nr:ATP-binding protein [Candidatus Paceibacterota bacterium]
MKQNGNAEIAAWFGIVIFYIIGVLVSSVSYTLPAIFPVGAAVVFTGLVIWGTRFWSAVFVGALIAGLIQGQTPFIIVLVAVANTLQAYAGARILRAFQFDPLLRRTRDVFSITLVAIVASMIVPTIVWLAFHYLPQMVGHPLPVSWPDFWIGHLWALLIAAPFFIRWIAKPFFIRTRREILETIAAFAMLIGIDYLLSWTTHTAVGGISLVYLLLVPLFWIAMRLGARFLMLAMALTNTIMLLGVTYGPYAQAALVPLGERLYQMEVFLIVIALIHYVVMGIDEERRQAVLALREQIKLMETVLERIRSEDQAKSEFLAILAHELRNPLAPILSGVELLNLRTDMPAEAMQTVEMINERVGMMRRLLDDLLDISRISRKKMDLKIAPIDLKAVLQHSIKAVNEFSIDNSHRYTIRLPEEHVQIDADEIRIAQIFGNLLKNAVKYTDPGGEVTISMTLEPSSARISVRDTGVGIPRDMLEKIFDPFQQIDTQRAHRGGSGLGIGLWLTKMLVEMHSGTVRAISEGAGKGSEFILMLPLSNKQRIIEETPPVAPQKQAKATQPRKILLVDDNIHAALGMKKLLEYAGHQCDLAYSGIEAVQLCEALQPEVVLLDIGLPDMDGYEVARILRAAQKYSGQLVALTGYGLAEDREKAYKAGFDKHLTKPVSVKDIQEILENGL